LSKVHQIDAGVYCIDLQFQGQPGVIASYLLESAGEWAVIEPGPTSTLEVLLDGMREIGVSPEDVTKVLVTHVHLDHAGAAGTFMSRAPGSTLYVHERGAPHMIDPSRLLASATRIYGDAMDALWGAFEPVPGDRIVVLTDDNEISIGDVHLRSLYTPGHASHHVVFHDSGRRRVFAGDVAAVRMQGFEYIRPPTPPPDIDLERWTASIDRITALQPDALCIAHFGQFHDAGNHLRQAGERLHQWAEVVEQAANSGQDRTEIVDTLRLLADDELLGLTSDAHVFRQYELACPLGMSVDGLLRFFSKRAARSSAST
jgi:glyoxylase-like metal-dependent hydrolase (beta-lactamase superfamily II)